MRTGSEQLGELLLSDLLAGAMRPEQLTSGRFREILDALPAAIYTTDAEGRLTYFNPACVELSGRRPTLGSDRWCVTWKLYHPDGTPMPHDKCPMAIALTEGRILRGAEAIAERPDGARIWFIPHPTPLRDSAGEIVGGINMLVDITDSKRREADSRALAALGAQMISADEPQAIYEKIIDAAVGLMRSDFASIQLFHPDRGEAGELQLLAHRGFNPEATKFWEWVSGKSTCVCGLTLRAGTRVVIPDAAGCDLLDAGQKEAYRDAGISAMQSTPLISRSGKLLGMISTHWSRPHEPTDSELGNFDILARQAADVLERSEAEQALRQNEAWLEAQSQALQSTLNGQRLELTLGVLVRAACDRFGPGTRTAFYRANADRTALHHIVGMCDEYAAIIDGFKISLESFSCGLAAHTRQPVLTADVNEEARWQPWLEVAQRFDFRGSWSFPMHAPEGELLGTFAVYWREPRRATGRDVTFASAVANTAAIILARHNEVRQRQQATASLARAKEEAETANIAKDNFLATLSHELRTPLTPVLATLSSWEARRSFPKEIAEDLEVVRRNVDLEARLIDDLLDLTRIAKGKFTLNLEVLDVQKVLEAAISMYRNEIKSKRINLSVRLDAGECFVQGDPARLQQVFWNVLKNAVKFTPEGGKIAVSARNDQEGHVQITFTDTGVGISESMLPRLFQPFEQETAGRYGGLGLGLAITKTLLEAQEGSIAAASDGPGKGASFILTLPCVNQRPSNAATTSPPVSETSSADGSYRVLLVEDHPDTARVLARLLSVNGHTVTTAHSMSEALEALRGEDFDVLLSDIGLPDGTGIDLIRAVRGELCKKMPAVALTGFGMEDDVRRTMQAGFNDHLTKPVNFARLEQILQRACKRPD